MASCLLTHHQVDWKWLTQAVPGGSNFSDNIMTTSVSQPSSFSSSRDDDSGSTPVDLTTGEYRQMHNLALDDNVEEKIEKPQELEPTVIHQEQGRLFSKVSACMSPEAGHRLLQTNLTPSEWQSVNDMPRVNRTPLTKRITPMKERIKSKREDFRSILCSSNDNLVPSSNCSTTSSKAGYNIADDTTCQSSNNSEQELVPLCFSKTGFDAIKIYNCEHDSNNNCGWSDISNGDVPSPADVTGPDEYCCARKKCGTESDDSTASSCGQSNEVEDVLGPGNRCIDDSDSDNDLGHFYSPQAKSSRFIQSTVTGTGSLGYISSYPSTINNAEENMTSIG